MSAVAGTSQLGRELSRSPFEKLRPRPNGLSRAEVVSHQRERLCRAMLVAAAEEGCDGTTISELCSLAGVSKRAFYEIFGDKHECLISAHEHVVCGVAQRMRRAPRIEGWPQESLQAAITALLVEAARKPALARFALLDAIDATPAGLERQRWASLQIEREIADRIEDTAKAPVSPLALRAIVAGISHLICTRLLDGRAAQLPLLAPKLTEWALACAAIVAPTQAHDNVERSAFSGSAGRPVERCLPQREKLFSQRNERSLLMESALALAAEGGMLRLSPDALASRSGVPVRRLHALFGDPQQCLIEAIRHGAAQLLDDAVTAASKHRQWQQRLSTGIEMLLCGLHSQGALAQALFVEALSLGTRAQPLRAQSVKRVAQILRQGILLEGPSSAVACEASVAAAWGLIAEQVAGTGSPRQGALASSIEALLLTPPLCERA